MKFREDLAKITCLYCVAQSYYSNSPWSKGDQIPFQHQEIFSIFLAQITNVLKFKGMVKKTALLFGSCALIAIYAFAEDTYTIRKGETLSQIVQRIFPHNLIYGRRGKLREILSLNPKLKNPHLVFPGQRVIIATQAPIEAKPVARKEVSLPEPRPIEIRREVSFTPIVEEWNLSLLYGAKQLSLNQSGSLGKASLGVIFLNDLKLSSIFTLEDWSFGLLFDSYKFKFVSPASSDSGKMYSFDFFASHKWIIGGIGSEQTPLFRNNGGVIEMTKQTLTYLSLGAKKDLDLPTRKPTKLKFKTSLRYPLSVSSEDPEIEMQSVKGLGIRGQLELNRQLFNQGTYSLHATWLTDLGYQKITRNVQWDTSSGEVKTSITEFSTSLGLLLKF